MFDVETFKNNAPIIPYIKNFYPDKFEITKETKGSLFCKCIFHQERTGSLVFFDKNNRYKCFGCGESGDIINLVSKIENLTFKEACEMIAHNTNQTVQFEEPNPHHEKYKDNMNNHANRYINNLNNNLDAMNYLLNIRKISPDTINAFRLGVTDKNEYQFRQDIGNISDKIVFPLIEHSTKPKCLGFSYRSYKDNNKPKYINDHNQDGREGQDPNLNGVFIKGNILYGFNQARKPARENNYIILCEGYFDVLSLYDCGIKNAVGIMSTNLTDNQILELKKLSNNIILMLDMDSAGKMSTLNHIKKLLLNNFNVGICEYDAHDPDELVNKLNHDGNKIHIEIINNITQSNEYIVKNITKDYNRIMSIERRKVINQLKEFEQFIPNEIDKDIIKKLVYKEIGL